MLLKSNASRIIAFCISNEIVSVIPGPNTIQDYQYAEMKESADFKRHVKDGVFEILVPTKEEKGDKDADKTEIGSLSVKDAKALVAETFNTEELKRWQEEETRKGVVDAIAAQLEKIEKERSESDKKDGEQNAE